MTCANSTPGFVIKSAWRASREALPATGVFLATGSRIRSRAGFLVFGFRSVRSFSLTGFTRRGPAGAGRRRKKKVTFPFARFALVRTSSQAVPIRRAAHLSIHAGERQLKISDGGGWGLVVGPRRRMAGILRD